MSTFYVWTLVIYMNTSALIPQSGGPTVIDNISTQQECERVAVLLTDRSGTRYTRCIQVQKVKP